MQVFNFHTTTGLNDHIPAVVMKPLVKSDMMCWRKLQVPREPVSEADNLYFS